MVNVSFGRIRMPEAWPIISKASLKRSEIRFSQESPEKAGCLRKHCHRSDSHTAGACWIPWATDFGGFWCLGRKGGVRAVGLSWFLVNILTVALGYTGCFGNRLCWSCSQQMSPAWPQWSDSEEATQVGIKRALQERPHNWGSICCNGLLFICLKCRQIAACGEPSHMINWPLFWAVWHWHFC